MSRGGGSPLSRLLAPHSLHTASSASPRGLLQRKLLLGHAERGPLGRLRDNALERFELYMGNMRGRGSNRQAAVAKFFCSLDHDAAELHDGNVAGAEALARAIGNRAHRLPHRNILVRNADDTCVTALLHLVTILQIIVGTGTDRTEVAVQVYTDLCSAKLPPCILIDAFAVAPGNEVEHGVGVVQRDVENRELVLVVRWDQHRERRYEKRDAQIIVSAGVLDGMPDGHVAKAEVRTLNRKSRPPVGL